MEPMRYDLHCCDGDSGRCRAEMEETEYGDYVSYESYAAQAAEIARLKAELVDLNESAACVQGEADAKNQWREVARDQQTTIDRLKARVAELEGELNSIYNESALNWQAQQVADSDPGDRH